MINLLSFFNELMVSLYLYLTLLLTDFIDSQVTENDAFKSRLRLQTAWILAILLIFTIALNFTVTYGKLLFDFYTYIKRKLEHRRIENRKKSAATIQIKPELVETAAAVPLNDSMTNMRMRNTTTTGVIESRLPTDEVQEKQIFTRSHHLAPEDFVKNDEIVQ